MVAEVEVEAVGKTIAEFWLKAHNRVKNMQVEESNLEARGVREANLEAGGVREAKVQEQIGSKMLQIAESAGFMARKVTCHVTV